MLLMPRRKNDFDIMGDVFRDDPFFDDFAPRRRPHHGPEMLKTDVKEDKDNYIFKIELPGVEKEDIKLKVENGYLDVVAEIKEEINEDKKRYVYQERSYGSFSRSFYVGESIKNEDIKASFNNGLLTLIVPKKEEKVLPENKYITIE